MVPRHLFGPNNIKNMKVEIIIAIAVPIILFGFALVVKIKESRKK